MPKKEKITVNEGSNKIGLVVALVLVTVLVVGLFFVVIHFKSKPSGGRKGESIANSLEKQGQKGQEMTDAEIKLLIQKVGKLILLPADVDPMIATIEDVDKLKIDQPFFQNAENGDKVLIYKNKALVYSSKKNVLINVGPVYTDSLAGNKESVVDLEPVILNLEVRNGTSVVGAGGRIANELGAKEEYKVIDISNAANKDYEETIIVNLSGNDVSALEKEFGVTAITELPEGELSSQSDVVVIIGGGE